MTKLHLRVQTDLSPSCWSSSFSTRWCWCRLLPSALQHLQLGFLLVLWDPLQEPLPQTVIVVCPWSCLQGRCLEYARGWFIFFLWSLQTGDDFSLGVCLCSLCVSLHSVFSFRQNSLSDCDEFIRGQWTASLFSAFHHDRLFVLFSGDSDLFSPFLSALSPLIVLTLGHFSPEPPGRLQLTYLPLVGCAWCGWSVWFISPPSDQCWVKSFVLPWRVSCLCGWKGTRAAQAEPGACQRWWCRPMAQKQQMLQAVWGVLAELRGLSSPCFTCSQCHTSLMESVMKKWTNSEKVWIIQNFSLPQGLKSFSLLPDMCLHIPDEYLKQVLKSTPGQQWHRQQRNAFGFGVLLSIHRNLWSFGAFSSQGLPFIFFLCHHTLISEEKIIGCCQNDNSYCPPTVLRDHLSLIGCLLCGSQQPGNTLLMLINIFFNHATLTWWYHSPANTFKNAMLYLLKQFSDLAACLLQLLSWEKKSHTPLLENSCHVRNLCKMEQSRNGDGHSWFC